MNEGDFYGRFLRSWVENEKIDAPLLAIIAVLAVHADIHTGISFPSQRRIAKLCGRNQPWVCKGLKKLESLGFIEIDRSYYEKIKRIHTVLNYLIIPFRKLSQVIPIRIRVIPLGIRVIPLGILTITKNKKQEQTRARRRSF